MVTSSRFDGRSTEKTARRWHKAPPDRWQVVFRDNETQTTERLPSESDSPPLDSSRLEEVFGLSQTLERFFGEPQDVEWTYAAGVLWALQSRPITHQHDQEEEDKRPWYLRVEPDMYLKDLTEGLRQIGIPNKDLKPGRLSLALKAAFGTKRPDLRIALSAVA